MPSFIKYGNQIVNLALVCGADYKIFPEGSVKMLGYKSILYLYTSDSKEIVFKDKDADDMWAFFCRESVEVPEMEG